MEIIWPQNQEKSLARATHLEVRKSRKTLLRCQKPRKCRCTAGAFFQSTRPLDVLTCPGKRRAFARWVRGMGLGRVESSSIFFQVVNPDKDGVTGHRKDRIKRGFLSSVQDILGTVPLDSFLRLLIEGSETCLSNCIMPFESKSKSCQQDTAGHSRIDSGVA